MKLYEEREMTTLRKRITAARIAAFAAAVIALCACIALCMATRTGNAVQTLAMTIAASTIGGWIVILLVTLVYRPSKAVLAHAAGLMGHPEEKVTGTVKSAGPVYSIPRSIAAARVSVDTGDGIVMMSVLADRLTCVPAPGSRAVFTVRRSYITEVEPL